MLPSRAAPNRPHTTPHRMNHAPGRGTRIQRSALVPFSAAQMYDLVVDVQAYPAFLPWCRRATVHQDEPHAMEATLEIAKGPLHKAFTTRNTLHPRTAIEIRLLRGPFRRLEGRWSFEDLEGKGSRVALAMDFEMAGALLGRALGPVFGEIANTLVDAFCRRARAVYDDPVT